MSDASNAQPRGLPGTAPGRGTIQPVGIYEPPPVVEAPGGNAPVVHFTGKDRRSATFRFAGLPLPQLHHDLARAFAARFGKGQVNTVTTAKGHWNMVRRFLRFLDTLAHPPQSMSELTGAQLKRYRLHVGKRMNARSVVGHFHDLHMLLRKIPAEDLRPEVIDTIWRTERLVWRRPGTPGYDDATFHAIASAARSSVVDIYRRISETERLLTRLENEPGNLTDGQARRAAELADMARTGHVPSRLHSGSWGTSPIPDLSSRLELAKQLFLTREDLIPLIVLGVIVTGRNTETVKELPVEHRILDGRAVTLEITKRRHGAGNWYEEVTWDIGRDSERLKSAGGYYLFCERLTRRGRQFSNSPVIWSIWTNGKKNGKNATAGHTNPFAATLGLKVPLHHWVRSRPELRKLPDFVLDMNRLKTTLDRINTRAAGGHLPSSTRSNTQDVLFRNYLAGDPDVGDWAKGVLAEALADAEDAARTAYRRARQANGELKVLPGPIDQARRNAGAAGAHIGLDEKTTEEVLEGQRDTAFASCTTAVEDCRASFLTCFACRNAVATADHLPAQLALLDELADRWEATDRETWWRRFGQAWLAINEDILPRFTPEERAAAEARKPADQVLPLFEGAVEEDTTWV